MMRKKSLVKPASVRPAASRRRESSRQDTSASGGIGTSSSVYTNASGRSASDDRFRSASHSS
eukprot:1416535-Prymnesium_polylepis.1